MGDLITYVGLDVHKEGIVVAMAEGGGRGEVGEYGRIANTAAALTRLLRKLGGAGARLWFCYEAGPCGYGIQRQLSAHGQECVVVAPSLIPRRAGDRLKGKFLGLRVKTLANVGAYISSERNLLATFGNVGTLTGTYDAAQSRWNCPRTSRAVPLFMSCNGRKPDLSPSRKSMSNCSARRGRALGVRRFTLLASLLNAR